MTTAFETVASGYRFCEAPRYADGGTVWFSDLLGGGYHGVRPDGETTTLLPDRVWIGGASFDAGDALVLGGRGGLVVVEDGVARPLLDTIGGERIIAINDIEADAAGGLYAGTMDFEAVFETGGFPKSGTFFHLAPDGTITELREGLACSNGVGFSPDGQTLYHSETTVGIWAWGLRDGIAAGPPALFAKADDCDGLAVDAEGGVWVAFWREAMIRRYRPDATIDREIALPFPNVVSLAFGGADRTDLYVTTAADEARPDVGGVIRIRGDIPGLPTHRSAFAKG